MFCYPCRSLVLVKESMLLKCGWRGSVEPDGGSVKYIVKTSVEWLTQIH